MFELSSSVGSVTAVLQAGGDVRTPATEFEAIFRVFLVLGVLVGVVVLVYMTYNAVKFRAGGPNTAEGDADRPRLGELPTGSGGGRKLFLSFGLSAVIVLSLIAWTYSSLLYVEGDPPGDDALDVEVEGYQWGWAFTYPNGYTDSTLRVPADRPVRLTLTSRDVFHNFGVPELRVKADVIPGQETDAWFVAEEPGTHTINCYELCGAGHSYMSADLVVMEPDAYETWYAGTDNSSEGSEPDGNETTSANGTTTANATLAGVLP
ncbi:cytochrome c oxidase subunit II [Halobium salinum]|uniref:Cytochrome c oxidase subunit II n=1 Tax=Halobium salinum TaxID=1364940 RepID=A0ABD5PEF4_9EURY|nr:cytochrome c oxidase subunit II [Halobium salinum]